MSILKMSLPNFLGGLGVVVIVSLVTVGWQYFKEDEPKSPGIYEPKNDERVSHKTPVQGWYNKTEANVNLWLVVQPVESPHYHPQPGPVPIDNDGQWRGIVYLGESPRKNVGEEFLLFLIAANPDISQVFTDYLENSASQNRWIGLQTLPHGSTTIDSVRLVRR